MKILIFLFVVCFVKIGQHIVLAQSSNGLNYTQITGNPLNSLRNFLFDNYYKDLMPINLDGNPINISLAFGLIQITNMDDVKETMTSNGWLQLKWYDYRFKWNPNDFSGIDSFTQPQSNLWLPDLILNNNADSSSMNLFQQLFLLAGIRSDGTVEVSPQFTLTSSCELEISKFPFDKRTCKLEFSSQWYNSSGINLNIFTSYSNNVALTNYKENSGWKLLSTRTEIVPVKWPNDNTPASYFIVTLNLQRKTLYYAFNFMYPCIIISFLCILGFILPADSSEKVTLEISNVLTIMVFTQLVSSITPASSEGIPVLSIYFASVSFLCTFSVIANVFIIRLNHKNIKLGQIMPKWFEKLVCNHLARALLMKPLHKVKSFYNISRVEELTLKATKIQSASIFDLVKSEIPKNNESDKLKELLVVSFSLLEDILENIKFFKKYLNYREKEENEMLKWKFAVNVMDRFFLVLTSLYSVVTFVGLIIANPNFYNFSS